VSSPANASILTRRSSSLLGCQCRPLHAICCLFSALLPQCRYPPRRSACQILKALFFLVPHARPSSICAALRLQLFDFATTTVEIQQSFLPPARPSTDGRVKSGQCCSPPTTLLRPLPHCHSGSSIGKPFSLRHSLLQMHHENYCSVPNAGRRPLTALCCNPPSLYHSDVSACSTSELPLSRHQSPIRRFFFDRSFHLNCFVRSSISPGPCACACLSPPFLSSSRYTALRPHLRARADDPQRKVTRKRESRFLVLLLKKHGESLVGEVAA